MLMSKKNAFLILTALTLAMVIFFYYLYRENKSIFPTQSKNNTGQTVKKRTVEDIRADLDKMNKNLTNRQTRQEIEASLNKMNKNLKTRESVESIKADLDKMNQNLNK
jgi:hypothetical protein